MRILVRTSRLASWARRFGSFALPLLVIPVFLHRAMLINSDTFMLIEGIAMIVALAALLFGLGAYARLWFTGDMGWGRASSGVVLGTICLLPLAAVAYFGQAYPFTADVATNGGQSLEMVLFTSRQRSEAPSQSEIVEAFPNVVAREYPIRVNTLFGLVEDEIANRGWEVLDRQPPQLEEAAGQVNAIDTTWTGFRDEVAVRVITSGGDAEESAQVLMRSASLFGAHDLGQNGRRIESFLLALDEAVTDILRNAPLTEIAPEPAVPN